MKNLFLILFIAGNWKQVTRFRYDAKKEDWFLYKDHYTRYKLNDRKDENADALVTDVDRTRTAKDFGIVSFKQFDFYKDE